MITFLDFEKPIAELEGKIRDLRKLSGGDSSMDLSDEVDRLQSKRDRLLGEAYAGLSPWQKTQVARHPERPHFSDIVAHLFTDFTPLAGDRSFGEDQALMGGLARFNGRSVLVMGNEKGTDTPSRIKHNFGMSRPEGYRKAVRLMDLADRFGLPVLTFVDTPGAYPGIGAEERGQSEAIAKSTERCLRLGVPVVATIVGEGGSGGAVALAAGNRVLMFEHAIYSVISPEGCASILWRTSDKAKDAATALKITAQDLVKLGVADGIIPEPLGGAHREPKRALDALGEAVQDALSEMDGIPADRLRQLRRERFLAIGRL
ncbi:acetyl-coenzyme A carboxylase carboxyl transferase subunit alpha [Iodidimonas muriae]|uniref:Acetyl-coenzyme A carboxylase carboxyl transferase subunit alpha n=1 Tax=Iodidimonas muriae TaxID=261467 RepID=A0ABQ2LAI2_9PROT|nr:acetyl-CoA carboxylase carboxyltransferase subunit alpha [Iodidimonas muriae]GER06090.1 acetyl-coenzyme A carboxylase carboxyl transferase subunit alpha [Kordiimonadales bacterium JCM 17843]GGO08174.1 acetyl-coenzyme A carboxylase carboxyl transferase subunit alpha [Iodidimonas muriae]